MYCINSIFIQKHHYRSLQIYFTCSLHMRPRANHTGANCQHFLGGVAGFIAFRFASQPLSTG